VSVNIAETFLTSDYFDKNMIKNDLTECNCVKLLRHDIIITGTRTHAVPVPVAAGSTLNGE
jgi:hypothetical protein